MAVASQPETQVGSSLQEMAKRHLWMHFSRMGGYGEGSEIPIIAQMLECSVVSMVRQFVTSSGAVMTFHSASETTTTLSDR